MSKQLIDHSPDLQRLRDDGYDIEIRDGYLLIHNVPYVNSARVIKFGTIVSTLDLAGDAAIPPRTHVASFVGEYPCDKDGSPITQIQHGGRQTLDKGLVVDHSFSAKATTNGQHRDYTDYHEKMTAYIAVLSGAAEALDPNVTARIFPKVESDDKESIFNYVDTASSRAGINFVARKLELEKIAIIGAGGTGSYVLDLVAKTRVGQIHVFDGDKFSNHNAFRSPGAPSVDELRAHPTKAAHFSRLYSAMHRQIIAHEYYINVDTVVELREMDFVFLCLDRGNDKRLIVERLEEWGISFIDVGMGVAAFDESLQGIVRVTTSSRDKRDHVHNKNRIPFSDGNENADYSRNIQIADLNALNAALAVIRWKKLFGFYEDTEHEHFSAYVVGGNTLINEDKAP